MQTVGYVKVNGRVIRVLVRTGEYSRTFKRRDSGRAGMHYEDESAYLAINPVLADKLLAGQVASPGGCQRT